MLTDIKRHEINFERRSFENQKRKSKETNQQKNEKDVREMVNAVTKVMTKNVCED